MYFVGKLDGREISDSTLYFSFLPLLFILQIVLDLKSILPVNRQFSEYISGINMNHIFLRSIFLLCQSRMSVVDARLNQPQSTVAGLVPKQACIQLQTSPTAMLVAHPIFPSYSFSKTKTSYSFKVRGSVSLLGIP